MVKSAPCRRWCGARRRLDARALHRAGLQPGGLLRPARDHSIGARLQPGEAGGAVSRICARRATTSSPASRKWWRPRSTAVAVTATSTPRSPARAITPPSAKMEEILADAGSLIPTMENMYPYTAGSTTGDAIFPPEMRAGSRAEFLARLRDPSLRGAMADKMRHDTKSWDNFIAFCGGLQGIQIAGVKPGVGDRLARLAARRRRPRRRRRRSESAAAYRRGVRLLRRERRRDFHHHPLRQRGHGRALLPPPDHGDLHRWPDARPGTEAASARARRLPQGAAHGPRDGIPAGADDLAHGDAAVPLPQPARSDAEDRRRRFAGAVRPGNRGRT